MGSRIRVRRPAVVLCAIVAVLSLPAAARPQAAGGNPFQAASRSAAVFFVPLDPHARQLLDATLPALDKWLPKYQELGVVPARASWRNPSRGGQLSTSSIENGLLSDFRRAQGSRPILLMAVSSEAVYWPTAPEDRFVFATWGQPHDLQYSAAFGTEPMRGFQPKLERSRLTKMMLRYVGEIVCRPWLRPNVNPRSVMYDPLVSTADLDRMVATLPAHCRRD